MSEILDTFQKFLPCFQDSCNLPEILTEGLWNGGRGISSSAELFFLTEKISNSIIPPSNSHPPAPIFCPRYNSEASSCLKSLRQSILISEVDNSLKNNYSLSKDTVFHDSGFEKLF